MKKIIFADDLVQRLRSKTPIGAVGRVTLDECIAEINYAEPVQLTKVDRPQGEWAGFTYESPVGFIAEHAYCPFCGFKPKRFPLRYQFCPMCGAYLWGELMKKLNNE